MELYLNADLPQGKKCGYRDPKTNSVVKNWFLYPDKPTEVPDDVAETMLNQNPNTISKKEFKKKVVKHDNIVLNPSTSENENVVNKYQEALKENEALKQEIAKLRNKIKEQAKVISDLETEKTPGPVKPGDEKPKNLDDYIDSLGDKKFEELRDIAKKIKNKMHPTGLVLPVPCTKEQALKLIKAALTE